MKRARIVLWCISLGVLILIAATLLPMPLQLGLVAATLVICGLCTFVIDLPAFAGAASGALAAAMVAVIATVADRDALAVFAPWIAACAFAGWAALFLVRRLRSRKQPR